MDTRPTSDTAEASSPLPRFSLRLKLTAWHVAIFLVVQLLLAYVFEGYMRHSITSFFNGRYVIRFREVTKQLRPHLAGITDERLAAEEQEVRRVLLIPHFALQVFDERGKLVACGRRPAVLPTPTQLEALMRITDPVAVDLPAEVLHDPELHAAYTIAGWVPADNGERFLVMASRDDSAPQQMLGLLSSVVLYSIPIGVIAVALSAYLISGIAVRPLRDFREAARRLDPQSLGNKLEMHATGSEAAELQAELERARQRIEAAFASQERFMSNVSHELKTPIAVMLAEAQTVKVKDAPKDVRAFLLSATDELEKLSRTVDSFLMLTRVRHGKGALQNAEVCLARDIVVDSYEGCAPMAEQHGVRIDTRLPEGEDADAAVVGNRDLLRTVLDNLIRNAVRFSPREQVVECRAMVKGDRLLIAVRDLGPGIPAELLPRVFDRFAQAKEEEKRGRGHGLGLEIALGITELHRGTISVKNLPPQEGGGCEFTVSLPLAVGGALPGGPSPGGREG